MVGCWPPSAQWNNTWTSGRRLSLGERFHASSQILPNRTASILSCLKFVLRFFLLSCALMGRIAPFIENVCSTTDSALPWLDDWKSRVRSSIEAAHVRLKFWLLCCPPVALNHDSENTHDGNNNLEIFNTKQHYNGAQQAQEQPLLDVCTNKKTCLVSVSFQVNWNVLLFNCTLWLHISVLGDCSNLPARHHKSAHNFVSPPTISSHQVGFACIPCAQFAVPSLIIWC